MRANGGAPADSRHFGWLRLSRCGIPELAASSPVCERSEVFGAAAFGAARITFAVADVGLGV
ncbi:hypothetical protein, partial [Nocardia brasiliensis]|uniref:hypothetical protein n=1 Tax=Nocardia brasiliensis TaxID=37326 RepID=UPI0024567AAB